MIKVMYAICVCTAAIVGPGVCQFVPCISCALCREAYMAAALRHVRARLDDGLPLSIDRIAIVW
jgi:hypothetical protein